ncbi:MAG: 30S ribosomal protein S17 [Hormoscilla sp. GUM202]|nr:30S ribosomal protein S17 [Hormoscilla sp. GUM202]
MPIKERVGVVVSDKMQKTVVVAVENRSAHQKYGKIMVRTKRYKAHDEENRCKEGDRVRIRETRPLSRTKRWMVSEILTKEAKVKDLSASASPEAASSPEASSPEAAGSPEAPVSPEAAGSPEASSPEAEANS